jgi:hypothetical protein
LQPAVALVFWKLLPMFLPEMSILLLLAESLMLVMLVFARLEI